MAHQTNVITNKRRCAARARHKIRGFIKILHRSSDSDGGWSHHTPIILTISLNYILIPIISIQLNIILRESLVVRRHLFFL